MSDAPPYRLLIVEDDPEIRYLLTAILASDDREIISLERGGDAIELLEREAIDLVVLDLILPDMDGRSVLTSIRERSATASTPVVVISARGGSEIRQDCFDLGADSFTEKPFDPEEVAAEISARLERRAEPDAVALIDPVSGLLSRAGLVAECAEFASGFGLALIQLDGFLSISEKWGWEPAERVLREVGEAIRASVEEEVLACRLGGGEFAIVVPGAAVEAVAGQSQVVLEAIRILLIADPEGETLRLTASIGVVEVDVNVGLDAAMDGARRRLFRARESGRNQVVWEDSRAEGTETRVLVAEDDEISATILVHRLRKEGLEVVRYANGREAYEAALEEIPALVILDVKMPGMDGFEILERLRRTPSYANVPIILLTSMGSEADVVRGFQLGADDYILKPFSPIELSARVWRLLRRGRSPEAV